MLLPGIGIFMQQITLEEDALDDHGEQRML